MLTQVTCSKVVHKGILQSLSKGSLLVTSSIPVLLVVSCKQISDANDETMRASCEKQAARKLLSIYSSYSIAVSRPQLLCNKTACRACEGLLGWHEDARGLWQCP